MFHFEDTWIWASEFSPALVFQCENVWMFWSISIWKILQVICIMVPYYLLCKESVLYFESALSAVINIYKCLRKKKQTSKMVFLPIGSIFNKWLFKKVWFLLQQALPIYNWNITCACQRLHGAIIVFRAIQHWNTQFALGLLDK